MSPELKAYLLEQFELLAFRFDFDVLFFLGIVYLTLPFTSMDLWSLLYPGLERVGVVWLKHVVGLRPLSASSILDLDTILGGLFDVYDVFLCDLHSGP